MVATSAVIQSTIDTFRNAAEANRTAPARDDNLVNLTAEHGREVFVTADLHGQRLHFKKLLRIADLDGISDRQLIMQEVCHGGPKYPGTSACMSHLLLEDVAALKVRYPDRFHFLISNHEMAELTDYPIAKGGQMLNMQFRRGLQQMYGDSVSAVRDAIIEFLSTCPLAARLANGVFICHGSPENVDQFGFDEGVLKRRLRPSDMQPGGAAFQMVWGRDFRSENAEAIAKAVGAEILLHGHEPCYDGFRAPNPRQVILDCCGPKASFVVLPISDPITQLEIIGRIQRLNEITDL